jgi:hypothetical protein
MSKCSHFYQERPVRPPNWAPSCAYDTGPFLRGPPRARPKRRPVETASPGAGGLPEARRRSRSSRRSPRRGRHLKTALDRSQSLTSRVSPVRPRHHPGTAPGGSPVSRSCFSRLQSPTGRPVAGHPLRGDPSNSPAPPDNTASTCRLGLRGRSLGLEVAHHRGSSIPAPPDATTRDLEGRGRTAPATPSSSPLDETWPASLPLERPRSASDRPRHGEARVW